jgi:hypothetical protein
MRSLIVLSYGDRKLWNFSSTTKNVFIHIETDHFVLQFDQYFIKMRQILSLMSYFQFHHTQHTYLIIFHFLFIILFSAFIRKRHWYFLISFIKNINNLHPSPSRQSLSHNKLEIVRKWLALYLPENIFCWVVPVTLDAFGNGKFWLEVGGLDWRLGI